MNEPRRSPADAPSRTDRLLRALEEAGGRGPGWLWLLLGWIFARNLLEGMLERPRALGFDWREDVSATMVFLHFPIFYLVLFAAIVLWLHLLSRRSLGGAARATSLAFGVLLIAPLIDAVASGGRGYDLNYLGGFGSYLWRFWDPRVPLAEVSPGQRIEICLACLLGGAYVWAARGRRALGFALAAALGVYLLAALAGAWPSLYARGLAAGSPAPGGDLGSAVNAYDRTFRGPGLIASESRRHAIVMALPLLALLPLLAWRADPHRFRAILVRLPWTRLLYYAGLAPAGVVLGWALFREYLPLHGPLGLYGLADPAAVVTLTAAMLFAVLAAVCWNDLADLEADRVNAQDRPLPGGWIAPDEVTRLGRVFAALALGLGLCVSYVSFLLLLACLFLSWIYSAPPLRLKRLPFLATGVLGLLSLLSLTAGFALFAQENAPMVLPGRLALALFVGVFLGFQIKDLKDRDGDRAQGVITLATLLSPRAARRLLSAFVAAGYLAVPLLLPLGIHLVLVSIGFAAGSLWIGLRRRRPDSWLLVGFCLYAGILLGLIARHPEPLRQHVPRLLIEGSAAILRQGRPALERAGTEVTSPPETWRHRAESWSAVADDPARVRAAAQAQAELAPLDPAPHQRSVEAAFLLQDYSGALAAAQRALGLGVRPAWFLQQSAAARVAGATGTARTPPVTSEIRGAALLQASNGTLFVLAGDHLRQTGRDAAAGAAYLRATQVDPDNGEAWAGLGEAEHAAGRLRPAIEAFLHAASLQPSDATIRNNLGVALRDAGRLAEARGQFEEALRLDPVMFEPIYNLALTAEAEGRIEEALAHARRAQQRRTDFAPVIALVERLVRTAPAPAAGDPLPPR